MCGTEEAAIMVLNSICGSMDDVLTMAFDLVEYSILIGSLKSYEMYGLKLVTKGNMSPVGYKSYFN